MKAFRSASRTESVPGTIEALEDLAGLEPRVVRFVIPVGANVSMSGTAVVAAATAVVIARLDGVELGAVEACIIGDRFRTTVNIYSDSVGSAIVQQFSPLETFEDSGEETSVVQTQAAPKPAVPPQSKPEPEAIVPETWPKDELNRESVEEPEMPSSWFKRRLSMFAGFPGQRAAGGAGRKSSVGSASSHGSTSHVLRPMSQGSTDADVPHSPRAETSHVNDTEYSGAFSPIPEGITVLGGSPAAVISPRKGTGATPSSATGKQDGHEDQRVETPPITNTAASDGTGAVGDVSSGKGRRRRQKKVKEASRKRSDYPHPRRSKKSRAKESLSPNMPKAVTVRVPDEVPTVFHHAVRTIPCDLGSEASLAPQFGATVGAAAKPAI